MAEFLSFRAKVFAVLFVRGHFERHPLDDLEAQGFDRRLLARIVRQKPQATDTELDEHLPADAVIALVGRETELDVSLDRIEPFSVLKTISSDLVLETDASAFLPQVKDDAPALSLDLLHRAIELLAAVAAQRVEGVPGEAFAVKPHQHRLAGRYVPLDQGDVVDLVDLVFVDDRPEASGVASGQVRWR